MDCCLPSKGELMHSEKYDKRICTSDMHFKLIELEFHADTNSARYYFQLIYIDIVHPFHI